MKPTDLQRLRVLERKFFRVLAELSEFLHERGRKKPPSDMSLPTPQPEIIEILKKHKPDRVTSPEIRKELMAGSHKITLRTVKRHLRKLMDLGLVDNSTDWRNPGYGLVE